MAKKSLKWSKVSKLICVFCYKAIKNDVHTTNKFNNATDSNFDSKAAQPSSSSNVTAVERLWICDKFYHQLTHPSSNSRYIANKKGKSDSLEKGDPNVENFGIQKIASLWNPEKHSVCVDCFYAVQTHSRLFESVQRLQKILRWQLDKLHKVMKGAGKISSRLLQFQDNLRGDKHEEAVIEFRQNVYKTCRQKLKKDTGNAEDHLNSSHIAGMTRSIDKAVQCHVPVTLSDQSVKTEEKLDDKENFNEEEEEDTSKSSLPEGTGPIKIRILKVGISQPKRRRSSKATPTPLPTFPTILKCAKCSNTFESVEALTKHAKEEHWIIKVEPGEANNAMEGESIVVECNVEINQGTREEQRRLTKLLESTQVDIQPQRAFESDPQSASMSDSDQDATTIHPELKRIVNSLKPHDFPNETDNNTVSSKKQQPEQIKLCPIKRKRKESIQSSGERRPKKKRSCTLSCATCQQTFTANLKFKAETELMQHLEDTALHNGKASWKHVCKKCNKLCINKSALEYHTSRVHARRKKCRRFSCTHCQKKFFTEENLINHFSWKHPDQIKTLEVRQKKWRSEDNTDGNREESMWEDCDGEGDTRETVAKMEVFVVNE